jgi:hypothetical protein
MAKRSRTGPTKKKMPLVVGGEQGSLISVGFGGENLHDGRKPLGAAPSHADNRESKGRDDEAWGCKSSE